MSSFSISEAVSYKKVFLRFLQNSLKISKLSVMQSFFYASLMPITFFLSSSLDYLILIVIHLCLPVLILEVIPQKNASQLFSIRLLENTSRMQCTETLWLHTLSTRKTGSIIFKKIENTVYARFTQELLRLIFIFFG